MHLLNINVLNFKNYEEILISFNSKLNCFVGNNGVGKTNLLDAIYYLCMCKSYFQSTDAFSIKQGNDFMMLKGNFIKNNTSEEIYCGLKSGKRKIFKKNKKEYQKLSEHIGSFPVVMVSPSDSALIIDGSEERRRYINSVISQYNSVYLDDLINYNKLIAQRNRTIKDGKGQFSKVKDLLEIYDTQLIPIGTRIFEERARFINELLPVFKDFYSTISENKEDVILKYNSQLKNNSFKELLIQNIEKDIFAQYTTTGIHKDDIDLLMQKLPIKKIGSQGQQKSFLVALKLAQFSFLKKIKNISPLLLLDDIFDKFDVNRVKQILNLVADKEFGQIFITHTNKQRMLELLADYSGNYALFEVDKGIITKIAE